MIFVVDNSSSRLPETLQKKFLILDQRSTDNIDDKVVERNSVLILSSQKQNFI